MDIFNGWPEEAYSFKVTHDFTIRGINLLKKKHFFLENLGLCVHHTNNTSLKVNVSQVGQRGMPLKYSVSMAILTVSLSNRSTFIPWTLLVMLLI